LSRKSPLITVMAAAADKAARSLLRDFNEVENLQVSRKGTNDFVTAADLRAEQVLKDELSRARPGFGFLTEESKPVPAKDGQNRWIIDPLDGTLNFIHSVPQFCISIGVETDGELTAGIVFDPLRDELFWAERGEGAWVNQRRLRCSKRERLADCLIAHGRARIEEPGDQERLLAQMGYVMRHTRDLRRMGSAALDLCYVGAGRYDGFWEEGLKPWDIAAGIIIAQEAGVYITDTSGGPVSVKTGSVLAGNPNIHSQLHKALAGR
jgi:myo-inositol-1(or 4)-monophosphatase